MTIRQGTGKPFSLDHRRGRRYLSDVAAVAGRQCPLLPGCLCSGALGLTQPLSKVAVCPGILLFGCLVPLATALLSWPRLRYAQLRLLSWRRLCCALHRLLSWRLLCCALHRLLSWRLLCCALHRLLSWRLLCCALHRLLSWRLLCCALHRLLSWRLLCCALHRLLSWRLSHRRVLPACPC